jgi:ABC-2 type transport system permease protein
MNHLPLLVRREFWEHRAFVIAPAAVAVIVLLGAMFGPMDLGDALAMLAEHPELRDDSGLMQKHVAIVGGVLTALALPWAIVVGCVIVFYLLDCLYADRKDRSVLFWKSLPVSDLSTVLSKLVTAAVVLPLLAFGATVVTNLLLAVIESIRSSMGGHNVWSLVWVPYPWFAAHALILYSIIVAMLWYLPIVAWLLLISAWARRAVILWAVLPPLMVMFFEEVIFDTSYFARVLGHRFVGWIDAALQSDPFGERLLIMDGEVTQWSARLGSIIDPAGFIASPGLWIGIAVAGLLIWAAIEARRHRTEN